MTALDATALDPPALHVFDLDGTLLHGTSASVELARALGEEALLAELEEQSRAGALSNLEFHRRTNVLWRRLTPTLIQQTFDAAPWLEGIAEVWADIAARGEHLAVISMSPRFFVRLLEPLGATVYASENPLDGPVDPALILEAESKVAITTTLRERHGVPSHRVVAYGDSYTDVPLFRSGVRSVSVNATSELEALAERRYWGRKLLGAYALGRALLDRPAESDSCQPGRRRSGVVS